MNRYVLFFMFVNIQVSTTLPIWDFFSRQTEGDPVANFKNNLDRVAIDQDNLYNHEVSVLNTECSRYLESLAKLPYPNKKEMLHDLKKEAEFCVGTYAQEKAEAEYERRTTHYLLDKILLGKELYDASTQEKRGQKAYQKAINKFRKGTSGSLSYLFDGYSTNAFKKVEEECQKRLLMRSAWLNWLRHETSSEKQQKN